LSYHRYIASRRSRQNPVMLAELVAAGFLERHNSPVETFFDPEEG
jgi:hypothetical protein